MPGAASGRKTMRINFSVTEGESTERECPADKPIRSIKLEAMDSLALDSAQADRYLVAFAGQKLDETKTLAELAVPEDSTLILWRMGSPARTSPLDPQLRTSRLYTEF
jgi:hypothetical protein